MLIPQISIGHLNRLEEHSNVAPAATLRWVCCLEIFFAIWLVSALVTAWSGRDGKGVKALPLSGDG